MENRIGHNRKSPVNEDAYRNAYLKKNLSAQKADGLDIAAVILKDGTKGHGLLREELNRSHDRKNHVIKDFISDDKLKVGNK